MMKNRVCVLKWTSLPVQIMPLSYSIFGITGLVHRGQQYAHSKYQIFWTEII